MLLKPPNMLKDETGTKTIYLIRHGETDLNTNNILQGSRSNKSLNTKGRHQSQLFYNAYSHIPFQKIYTSTLKRSIESVENFIKLKIPLEQVEELNEIDYGIYDGIASTNEKNGIYEIITNQWNNGIVESKMDNGESPLEVEKRIQHFIDKKIKSGKEDILLICMHGRAMRIFLSVLLNTELKDMNQFKHSNMGLYIIKINNSMACLECINNTYHLNGIINNTK